MQSPYFWILILIFALKPAAAAQWRTAGRTAWSGGTLKGVEVAPEGGLRLISFSGVNLALRSRVRIDGRTTNNFMTDGKRSTEYTFFEDPQVLGRTLTLDLSRDQRVNRVYIVPGEDTAVEEPEFFLKGYRIDAAPAERPNDWLLVAEQKVNDHPVIDTTADSTWKRFGEEGPEPVLARYLRLTITREDLPNPVSIGEIEVYGTGFQESGEYVSPVRDFRAPVNLGALSWAGATPKGTRLRLQVRSSRDNATWPAWDQVPEYPAGAYTIEQAVEPVRYAQFRAQVETDDPLMSPGLEEVVLVYETRLVAQAATGVVRPRQATIGAPVVLTYRVEVDLTSRDRGVDLISLDRWREVEELRIDGVVVPPQGYEIAAPAPGAVQPAWLAIRLRPEYRLAASATLELAFTTLFLTETSAVGMVLGTAPGEVASLQRVDAVHPDSIRVAVSGVLEGLVPPSSVQVVPPVIRPGEEARIHFDLGWVTQPVPVSVGIYDLSGRCIRRLLDREPLYAGPIAVPWDGCATDGRPLLPGIYLYRIEVEAEQPTTLVRTLGVAY